MLNLRRPSLMAVAASLTTTSLLISACGGGGGSKKADPDDWISDLCDLAIDADDDLTEIGMDVDFGDKDEVLDLLDEAIAISKDLRKDFDDIGEPDVEDGDKVRKAFQKSLDARRGAFEDVRDDVDEIDEDDDDFEDQVFEILDDQPESELRDDLGDLADDSDDVADLVDDVDAECGDVIFASAAPAAGAPAGLRA